MNPRLSELKKLHDKGMALIYLHPKSKRPLESGWTTQKKKSWDELENSFEKTYNVGVRLGHPSKLISGNYLGAIDCDVKSITRKAKREMNDALRKLGIDLASAPVVMSGRGNGSKHIYVQTKIPMQPRKFASSLHLVKVKMQGETRPHSKKEMKELTLEERTAGYRIRAAWEIALMGNGQQTVLPPSVHPDTGYCYDWANPLTVKHLPVFKAPHCEQKRHNIHNLTENAPESFKPESVSLWASRLPSGLVQTIVDGSNCNDRSAALLSSALSMCRHGFTDNQILSVLSDPDNWIAQTAYDHVQSQSRAKAVRWLTRYTLQKARFETSPMRWFENPPELRPLSKREKKKQAAHLEKDDHKVFPDRDGKQKPKTTLRNMVHAMEHFLGGGLVGFNEFSCRPYFLKDTPYGGVKGKELADHDDLSLKHYLACNYQFEPSKELCFETHSFLARKHRWHPVRTYLNSLEWDEVPRLDTWLREAFGASGPEAYLSAVSRKVLTAAVARVFDPGCKFDYVTVLEGKQGEGKSMSLGILASQDWFTDGLGDIHNKDVVDQMTGKWIIELAELAAIRGRENEHIKSFFTRQVDRVRAPYGRRSEDYPRQSIFIGSTNSAEYFTDETGNRRYWPVRVNTANRKWLKQNRDQLWAEAMVRYRLGEDLYLTAEIEAIAKKEQEKRFEVDEWEAEIKKALKGSTDPHHLTSELWQSFNFGNSSSTQADMRRIGKIMHRLGYMRAVRKIDGLNTRVWVLAHNG